MMPRAERFDGYYLVLYGMKDDMPKGVFFSWGEVMRFLGRKNESYSKLANLKHKVCKSVSSDGKLTVSDDRNNRYRVYKYKESRDERYVKKSQLQ